ncbi:cysteine hydrolase family protein [Singulisphaera sp. PoT]|uniref:cysteine hydrolase family protein n=1 Tax=Singulisphaera sp. PoT TaxID=3411797 RepID=UPI003BF4E01D
MLSSPFVFVDVDTQRDFLEPSGSLYIEGSSGILGNLARLTEFARSRAIPVVATACSHNLEDSELDQFPPHCMVDSPGQGRIAQTAWAESVVLTPETAFEGRIPPHLTLEKREFDVFSRVDADRVVETYGANAPTFVVYGVATDYCVRACVEGLLSRGCRLALVVDAVWPIHLDQEPALLTDLVGHGATLVMTDAICKG